MSVFDGPEFREWEHKEQEEQRQQMRSNGYELVDVSRPFPRIDEVDSIRGIRPEYELREIASGERIGGMIDCTCWQAIRWAAKKVDELTDRPA